MVFARQRSNERPNFFDCAVFVLTAVHEKFRLIALVEEGKIGAICGHAQTNQMRNARMLAADAQTHPRAKTESREQHWNTWKLCSERIERGPHIALFAYATIMFAAAQARAAKIEAQNRNAERIERLRRPINHFVVQGPAEKWMRMADHGGKWRPLPRRVGRRPENRFEAASRTFQ